MSGEDEGAATGGEYCTMGAGTAALQMMIPDADFNKNTSTRVAMRSYRCPIASRACVCLRCQAQTRDAELQRKT